MVLKINLSAVDYSSDNLAVSQLIPPMGSQFVCCFSNFNVHRNYLGTLLNINFDKVYLEGSNICFYIKLTGNADIAGLKTILRAARI